MRPRVDYAADAAYHYRQDGADDRENAIDVHRWTRVGLRLHDDLPPYSHLPGSYRIGDRVNWLDAPDRSDINEVDLLDVLSYEPLLNLVNPIVT